MKITSLQNSKIKDLVKLKDKNKRDKAKRFLIEGYREITKAILVDVEIETLFICEELFLKDNENSLIEKIKSKNVEVFETTQDVFKKVSYRDRPDGLIALAKQFEIKLDDVEKILSKKNPLILIMEKIEKPGNLGSILRSSDASGIDLVIVTDPVTDIFNPNVIRSSIGAIFTKPVFVTENEKVFELLKKHNINIIATTPHTDKIYFEIDYKKPTAILVGAEQYGLSDFWIQKADDLIKIPMMGIADSLNVAAAATLVLYEALRQRKFI